MLILDILPVGPLSTNCILAWNPSTLEGLIVDPGDEASRIRQRVEAAGFAVKAIVHTHGHFDHLGASRELQEHWNCPAYLHEADTYLVKTLDMQTDMFGMRRVQAPVLQPLKPGDVHFGLTVLHTPGHSPGGCCLLGECAGSTLLLSGDTLFLGGVGRTDIMGGSWESLKTSVLKLYELPDKTRVIPGHGPETTIAKEAQSNPFVRR
jgi:glyoxylase-like metal-dependent hydrolase (beta-lactamase superfamily II)